MSASPKAVRSMRLFGGKEIEMGIYCEFESHFDASDAAWWWSVPRGDFIPLESKRSRKCCSCGARIVPGSDVLKVRRYRPATEWEEVRGLGDDAQLAPWHLCETCGGLAMALLQHDFCFDLGRGESLKQQIAEYRASENAVTPNA